MSSAQTDFGQHQAQGHYLYLFAVKAQPTEVLYQIGIDDET